MTHTALAEQPDRPNEHPYSSSAARAPGRASAVRVAAATARNARTRNEDAIGVGGWVLSGEPSAPIGFELEPAPGGAPLLIAVTDGMGGAPDGDVAARLAAQLLTAALAGATAPGFDAERALSERFRSVDEAIREADPRTSPAMACTAALLMLHADGAAAVAHVGDVRLYRVIDSYLGQLTEDHRSRPDDSAVTRCLGGRRQSNAAPTVARLQVRSGDRLILCSDGIHDALEPAELERIASVPEPCTAAASFLAAAVAGKHGDNPTVVVIDFAGDADTSADEADGGSTEDEPRAKTERRRLALPGKRSRNRG